MHLFTYLWEFESIASSATSGQKWFQTNHILVKKQFCWSKLEYLPILSKKVTQYSKLQHKRNCGQFYSELQLS